MIKFLQLRKQMRKMSVLNSKKINQIKCVLCMRLVLCVCVSLYANIGCRELEMNNFIVEIEN